MDAMKPRLQPLAPRMPTGRAAAVNGSTSGLGAGAAAAEADPALCAGLPPPIPKDGSGSDATSATEEVL